jgi:hypothetical protein
MDEFADLRAPAGRASHSRKPAKQTHVVEERAAELGCGIRIVSSDMGDDLCEIA